LRDLAQAESEQDSLFHPDVNFPVVALSFCGANFAATKSVTKFKKYWKCILAELIGGSESMDGQV
jgi:hypothetical protein